MAIDFLSGKPGGGKTLLAVEMIVRELVGSGRVVVTNVPLRLPELNEFLQKEHPKVLVVLSERLQILTDDEMFMFFLYRGNGRKLGVVLDGDSKEPKPVRAKYEDVAGWTDRGVFYVLDELHLFFNARLWMRTGQAAMHYLSQHRKLGDDVWCVTQFTKNVDAQFRSVAQEFHQIRNLAKESWGVFRGPPRFKVISGQMDFSTGGKQDFNTRFFAFNKGFGGLYDTAAGVGMLGRTDADKGKKAKGVPIMWLFAAVVVVGGGLLMLPIYIPKLLKSFGEDKGVGAAIAAQVQAGSSVVPVAVAAPVSAAALAGVSGGVYSAAPGQSQEVYPTASMVKGSQVWILMSDGSRRWASRGREESDGIETVTPSAVTIDGRKVFFRAVPRVERPVEIPVYEEPTSFIIPLSSSLAPGSTLAGVPAGPLATVKSGGASSRRRVAPASAQYD